MTTATRGRAHVPGNQVGHAVAAEPQSRYAFRKAVVSVRTSRRTWPFAAGWSLGLATLGCSVDSRAVRTEGDTEQAGLSPGGAGATATPPEPMASRGGTAADASAGSTPPAPATANTGEPEPPTGAGGGASMPPSGSSCEGTRLAATVGPVNVLVLVDRSASMLEPLDANAPAGASRWDAVTDGLRAFFGSELAAARVGLQFFGVTDGADDCSIDKYRTPRVALAPLAANRAALLAALDATQPGSLTPTAPALTGALEHSLQLARAPENTGIPGIVVLLSDGIPSECGTLGPDGNTLLSVRDLIDPAQRFAQPPSDANGNPAQPPIRTYVVWLEPGNASALARAGGGQAFVVGAVGASGADIAGNIAAALLRIMSKPLGCELQLPAMAPGTSEPLDRERVRLRFTAPDGITNEVVRTDGPDTCSSTPAWYYSDAAGSLEIALCSNACQLLGTGDTLVEFGCAARRAAP